jgi:glycosyltransferase involved in cell wall biosynthesis
VLCGEGEEAIRRWFAENGAVPTLHFHFVRLTAQERALSRVPGMLYVAYRMWQWRAYERARELHRELRFDVVHQVTLSTYREPGYLGRLGVPFVWGPLGGSENYPWRFLPAAGARGAAREALRSLVNAAQLRLSPHVRSAARRADVVLSVNSDGDAAFERVLGVHPRRMIDVGISAVVERPEPRGARSGPLRLLWCGWFSSKRPFHLLVEALRRMPAGFDFELHVLGSGPLEGRWRGLVHEAGLDARCRFMRLPREQVFAEYHWADALVFLSLRDACGSVVLEALSQGLPVVCLAHQGAGDMVTDACGVRIPVTTPGEVVRQLREELAGLAADRSRLDALGRGALPRAREFLWSRKVDETARIYREVIRAPVAS